MDGFFLVPLAPFLFVLGIVWIVNQRKLEEKRISAAAARDNAQGATRDDGRIEELEERVRILERIVTDGSYDLGRQIEALRDDRVVGAMTGAPQPEARV
jgi:hypothetical protein